MQRAGQGVALSAGKIDDVAGLRQDAGRTAGDFPSGFGQHYTAPAALHQLDTERLLQLLNLHGKRRLGHRALFRGLAEMPDAGDGLKISELFERDHVSLNWISFSYQEPTLIRFDLIGNPS